MLAGGGGQAVGQPLPLLDEQLGQVQLFHFLQTGDAGRKRHGGKPIAARKRDAADGVLQKVPAAERGDIIAVGDGLAKADQVRLEAEIAVAARKAQAEAGAHVVDDQQRALLGAEPAHLLPEAVGRQLVVGEVAVHIRLRDDCGDLALMRFKQRLQSLKIVPVGVKVVADGG